MAAHLVRDWTTARRESFPCWRVLQDLLTDSLLDELAVLGAADLVLPPGQLEVSLSLAGACALGLEAGELKHVLAHGRLVLESLPEALHGGALDVLSVDLQSERCRCEVGEDPLVRPRAAEGDVHGQDGWKGIDGIARVVAVAASL